MRRREDEDWNTQSFQARLAREALPRFDGVIRVWDEFYRTPFQENVKSLVFMRLCAC
jgi:hypothetical protein